MAPEVAKGQPYNGAADVYGERQGLCPVHAAAAAAARFRQCIVRVVARVCDSCWQMFVLVVAGKFGVESCRKMLLRVADS